jgi:hypothetical protein
VGVPADMFAPQSIDIFSALGLYSLKAASFPNELSPKLSLSILTVRRCLREVGVIDPRRDLEGYYYCFSGIIFGIASERV